MMPSVDSAKFSDESLRVRDRSFLSLLLLLFLVSHSQLCIRRTDTGLYGDPSLNSDTIARPHRVSAYLIHAAVVPHHMFMRYDHPTKILPHVNILITKYIYI